jgi:hypothetical protein
MAIIFLQSLVKQIGDFKLSLAKNRMDRSYFLNLTMEKIPTQDIPSNNDFQLDSAIPHFSRLTGLSDFQPFTLPIGCNNGVFGIRISKQCILSILSCYYI